MLLKGSAHHLSKMKRDRPKKRGRAINFEKMIQDIVAGFDDYPKTQPSEDQSLFMIGYYHQRKDLFTSKPRRANQ